MNAENYLEELAARRRFGMRPGLDTIRGVLARLGNPEAGARCVHVAGTNGKGATSAMIDAVLRAAGYHVLRYTSPHLVRLNERFFVDGAPASDATLAAAASRVFDAVAAHESAGGEVTFFEALTAVAFELFRSLRDASADPGRWVAVMETGLGGRLDATNVIERPLVSVIVRIGLDHTEWLGATHAEIAAEKAGIVKPGCPVVAGAMPETAKDVVARAASLNGGKFIYAPEAVSVNVADSALDGQTLVVTTAACNLAPIRLPLGGTFQTENVVTAIAVADVLRRTGALELSDRAIVQGLSSVTWPGRFQLVRSDGVDILVDGAHNPDGARALRDAIRSAHVSRPICLVAGFCGDKDVLANLRILSAVATRGLAVPIRSSRSLDPAAVAERMQMAGFEAADPCASLDDAFARGRAWAKESGGILVVCGSLFLAGEALVALDAFPWAADDPYPNENLRPPA